MQILQSSNLLIGGLISICLHWVIYWLCFGAALPLPIDQFISQGTESPIMSVTLVAASDSAENKAIEPDIIYPHIEPTPSIGDIYIPIKTVNKKTDKKDKERNNKPENKKSIDNNQQQAKNKSDTKGQNNITQLGGDINKGSDTVKGDKGKLTNDYLSKLKIEIEKHKKYPRKARKLGYEGKVTLEMNISPDGSIYNINIGKSSGYEMLDNAAIEATKKFRSIGKKPVEIKNIIVVNILFKIN